MPNLTNYTEERKGSKSATYTQYQPGGTLSANYPYTTVTSEVAYRSTVNRSSVNTPGFLSKSRPALLPTNAYTYSKVETYYATGSLMTFDKSSRTSPYGSSVIAGIFGEAPTMTAGDTVSASEYSALMRTTENKLLERIKSQKVNLMQAYAERAQTRALIADNVMKIAKAIGRVKKGDVVGAAKALGVSPRVKQGLSKKSAKKHIASHWLELQYGWKPLVSDIYGAAEAYHKILSKRPQYGKATSEGTAADSQSWGPYDNGAAKYTEWREEEVTIKMGAYFYANGQTTKSLSELGITNPAMVAWELLPWSFVVDWFLPIGSFINNLDATLGVAFSGGYITIVRKQRSGTRWVYYSNASVERIGQKEAGQTRLAINRSKMVNFPSAQWPAFKDPFSATHFANALALLITNSRK